MSKITDNITDNLRAAYQEVQEKLKGGQHKLDHDGDGDIDGKDFAMLRAKKKKTEKTSATAAESVDLAEDNGRFVFDMKSKEHMNAAKKDLEAAGMSSRNRAGHSGGDHALHVKGSAKAIHKVMKKHASNMHDANMGSHHDMNDDTYGHRLTRESAEQSENINELSTDTLKRYRKKAKGDIIKRKAKDNIAKTGETGTYGARVDPKNAAGLGNRYRDKTNIRKQYRKIAKGKLVQKDEDTEINELSPDKMKQYRKKAAIDVVKRDAKKDIAKAKYGNIDTTDYDNKTKMRKGYRKLAKAKIMSAEAYEGVPAATHKGYQDPQGVGLSPSAKAQLAKKTPTAEPTDAPKVNDKNFKDFRKGLKTAAKRNGDNAKGDKTIISPATKA